GAHRHDARHRALVDELRRAAGRFEQDRKRVEAADMPPKLDAVDQIDRDRDVFLTHLVQECVLKIDLLLVHPMLSFRPAEDRIASLSVLTTSSATASATGSDGISIQRTRESALNQDICL